MARLIRMHTLGALENGEYQCEIAKGTKRLVEYAGNERMIVGLLLIRHIHTLTHLR